MENQGNMKMRIAQVGKVIDIQTQAEKRTPLLPGRKPQNPQQTPFRFPLQAALAIKQVWGGSGQAQFWWWKTGPFPSPQPSRCEPLAGLNGLNRTGNIFPEPKECNPHSTTLNAFIKKAYSWNNSLQTAKKRRFPDKAWFYEVAWAHAGGLTPSKRK